MQYRQWPRPTTRQRNCPGRRFERRSQAVFGICRRGVSQTAHAQMTASERMAFKTHEAHSSPSCVHAPMPHLFPHPSQIVAAYSTTWSSPHAKASSRNPSTPTPPNAAAPTATPVARNERLVSALSSIRLSPSCVIGCPGSVSLRPSEHAGRSHDASALLPKRDHVRMPSLRENSALPPRRVCFRTGVLEK